MLQDNHSKGKFPQIYRIKCVAQGFCLSEYLTSPSTSNSFRNGTVYRVTFTGVKQDIDQSDLEEHFESFGFIQCVHMDKTKTDGLTSGTGYVDFEHENDALSALEASPIRLGASLIRLRNGFL